MSDPITWERFKELQEENARLRAVVDAAREYCRVLCDRAPVPLTDALRELDKEEK